MNQDNIKIPGLLQVRFKKKEVVREGREMSDLSIV